MNNKVVTIPEEVSGTHEEGKQKEEAPGSPKVIRRAQKPGHRRRLHPLSCHFPLHDVDQTTILQGCQITPWKAQGNKHKAFMPHKAPIPWPETLNRWKREKKQQSSLDLKNGEPTTEKSKIVAPRSNENLTTHAPSTEVEANFLSIRLCFQNLTASWVPVLEFQTTDTESDCAVDHVKGGVESPPLTELTCKMVNTVLPKEGKQVISGLRGDCSAEEMDR